MKALRYLGPNQLEIMEMQKPVPGAEEVLLRIKACGICGSDVHGYLGLTGRRTPPMTMGHEFVGEVEAVGVNVNSLKPGDRVCPYPVDYCGICEKCKNGMNHLCPEKRQFGVLAVDGAFAEFLCVPAHLCFPIADGVSFDQASLMEPLAVAYHAVSLAGSLTGKHVLIVGAGTIGLLAMACCKLQNPASITMSDFSDSRLALARSIGADYTINPGKGESISDIDVAFEAVGAAGSVKSAMESLAFGGTAIWIGNNKPVIEVNMQQIVTHELKVKGSFLYSLKDFETVVDLINNGKLDVSKLLSRTISLEEAPAYFKQLAENPGELVKVVVHPNFIDSVNVEDVCKANEYKSQPNRRN